MKNIIFSKIIVLLFITLFFSLFFMSNATNAVQYSTFTTSPSATMPIGPGMKPPPAMNPSTPAIDDTNITVDVQFKISSNASLNGLGIMVSTNGGIVTLDGSVNNRGQAELAINLAKTTKGVKDVQSKLIVKQ